MLAPSDRSALELVFVHVMIMVQEPGEAVIDFISGPTRPTHPRLAAPVSAVASRQKETPADPSAVGREVSPSRRPAVPPFRVMLVDDHEVVRDELAGVLRTEEDIRIVAEAATGEEALELLEAAAPDVVVMDISMPGMGGVEATRRIVARLPDVRVVGLSMHRAQDVAAALHEVGAAGYVRKGAGTQALVDAIRRATRHS